MAQNTKFHNGKTTEENTFLAKPDSTRLLSYIPGLSAAVFVKVEGEGTMEKLHTIFNCCTGVGHLHRGSSPAVLLPCTGTACCFNQINLK